jgi:hypothetical protein
LSQEKSKRIVIDEEKEVARILSTTEKEFSYKSIYLLSKYYYSLGLSKKCVKNNIVEYLNKIEFNNDVFYEDDLEKILTKSKFYPMKRADLHVGITKSEIDVLKNLSHKDYKVALYILFLGKINKYQSIKIKETKAKSFKTFLNYNIKTCAYNVGIQLSEKEAFLLGHRLSLAGVIEPTLIEDTCVILCADYSDKKIEFIIDGKEDFLSQIKYHCTSCGKETKKNKHDYCDECQSIKNKENNRKRVQKHRKIV